MKTIPELQEIVYEFHKKLMDHDLNNQESIIVVAMLSSYVNAIAAKKFISEF